MKEENKKEKKVETEKGKESALEKEEKVTRKDEICDKAEEYLNSWKRCQADFENYKKRQVEERKDLITYANTNLILDILPVVDNFHASTDHIPEDQKNGAWVAGIMHIQKQLEKVLEDNGVAEIGIKEGDEFDPAVMEAVKSDSNDSNGHANDSNNANDNVKKVLVKGYRIGNKVVRAARVVVE